MENVKGIKEQMDKMKGIICRLGDKQQIKSQVIQGIINDLVDNEYTNDEILKMVSVLKEAKKEKRELTEEKRMIKKFRDMLQQQYLDYNEEFLSKANAVHNKTGELLVVEEDMDKHCKVRRSNHILNTLKKSDINMLK